MVTKAKKALLASLAAFLCVMLTVFGLSMSVSLSETAKAADETTTEVAEVNGVKFATLAEAIAAAKDGETVKLLADATEDVVVNKNITLDLGDKTITGTNTSNAYSHNGNTIVSLIIAEGAKATVKNGNIKGTAGGYTIQNNGTATFENLTATAGNTGSSMIDNWGTLTITSGTYTGGLNVVKSEEGSVLTINGGEFTRTSAPRFGITGTILVYGTTTITGGKFIDNTSSANARVLVTGVVKGYTAITKISGGKFTNKKANIFHCMSPATPDNFEISGGIFNKSIPYYICADGFIPTKNADGTYGVKPGKYVADVEGDGYETLAEAVAAAEDDDTVTLLDNITLTEQLVIGKALTIDLGGFTLTSNYSLGASGAGRYAIVLNEAVTIKNGKIVANNARVIGAYAAMTMDGVEVTNDIKSHDATVALCADGKDYAINNCKIDGSYSVSIFANNATVTITDSKLIGRGNTLYHNGSNYGLKLTVTGTTITTQNVEDASCGVYISGSTAAQSNAANQNGAGGYQQATFTGCTISGVTNGIEVKYTNLTLNSCSVSTTENTPSYKQDNNGPAASGFAVVSTDNAMDGTTPAPKGTIEVSGEGNYVGAIGIGTLIKNTYEGFKDASYAVSGGTFDHAILPEYCADGFIPTQNADGKYGVKVGVAEVNGVKYETLQAAIDAAARNATVKLLADTRANVTIKNALTLDLNGHTINGGTEKGKPAVTVTARVTIKDSSEAQTGTIMREDTEANSGVSSHYVIDVQGAGWLTFESGNVKNNSGNDEGKGASLVRVGDDSVAKFPGLNIKGGTFTQDNFIVIKIDSGDLFLNGGTLTSANSYAIEDWHRATVKGGTVNGDVAAWTYSGGLNSDLTISGGTINGNVTSVNYGNTTDKKATVSVTGGTITGELDTRSYDPATGDLTSINDAAKATIGVSGGTFKENPSKYLVEDSAITKNENGTYGVEKAYLARVGNTSYYTMDEAFKAQTASGEAIVLLRDYTTGSTFNSGTKHRVVDLNRHTWTYTGTDMNSAAFEINNPNASLTVKNGKIISSTIVGLIPSAMGGTIKYDNAGLVFENVDMTSNGSSGIETNGNNTNDSVTLKNSTLNVPNGFGIYFPSSGTLTINNSTINAKTMGVQVCSGTLNINAGSAITVNSDAVPKAENDGAIQDGAAISVVNRPGYKGLSDIVITGGTFTAKGENKAIKAYDWAEKTESTFTKADLIAVSGGTFTSAVPAEYCADRFIPQDNGDGTYGVKVGTYVAKIGEVGYKTLAEAIAAATNGQTVMLLTRVAENVVIDADKNFTLDLNGFTLNGKTVTAKAAITNKGTLVITDSSAAKTGTIKRDDNGIVGEKSYYVIRNLGTMTIEQANIVNNSGYRETNPNGSMVGSSLICNGDNDEGAKLTIKGGKLTQLNFIAIKNGANGTLVVNGGEITSNHSAVQNWYNATIKGGTIKGQLWTDAYKAGESVGNTVIDGNVQFTGEIVMDVYGSIKPELTINGGKLSVTNWRITPACAALGGKPAVKGGTFSSEVNKDYLADGFVVNKNTTDGTYGVTEGSGFAGANVVVTESLAMKVTIANGTASKYVVVTYKGLDGVDKSVKLDTLTDGCYLFDKIMPQMIDVKFSFELYGENDVMLDRKANYSVVDYLADIIASEKDSAAFRNVAASLIEYANKAKAVKGLATIAPEFVKGNEKVDLTELYKTFIADEKNKIPAKDTLGAISEGNAQVIYKAKVVFDDAYTLTFYTNVDEKQYTYKLDDKDIVFDENGEFTINVLAQDITTQYVIKVYGEDKTKPIQTVTYGVSTYCIRMQGTKTPQGELYVASYYYGVAVQQYGAPNTASVQG